MVFRYWDWGKTPQRDNYQFQLLRAVLENTKPEYGGYSLQRVMASFSTARARREINHGNQINVRVGPYHTPTSLSNPAVGANLSVDFPIAENLLGYRQLIIRKADLGKFASIKTEEELKKLTMGQGRGWEDVRLYRAEGYRVDDSANIDTLFQMLVRKRFDYISMSIIETSSFLSDDQFSSELTVAPSLFIYYPLPLVYYVGINESAMAERIKLGLLRLEQEGIKKKLFERFYAGEVEELKREGNTFFEVDNAVVPADFKLSPPYFRRP